MNRTLILACCASLSAAAQWDMDKMAFAFNYNRHGARTPLPYEASNIFDDELKSFKAAPGELTVPGMRQRYLTGRSHRERYVEKYGLLSNIYVPGEIYQHTTSYYRVNNSAQIELIGLYPPEESLDTVLPESLIDDLGEANPPFKVRDSEIISKRVGYTALPFGFQAIPFVC